MRLSFAAVLPLLGLGFASVIAPRASDVTVAAFSISGNGCPSTSLNATSYKFSDDFTQLNVTLPTFGVYIGPDYTIQNRTKNCSVRLSLAYPSGQTFAVATTNYHIWASVETGATATFFLTEFFAQDAEKTVALQASIAGDDFWAKGSGATVAYTIADEDKLWAPCDGSAIISTTNRVAMSATDSAATGKVLLQQDASGSGSYTVVLSLVWKACSA